MAVLITVTCCNCFIDFGMAEAMHAARKRDAEWFYCPAGHKQHFSESELDRVRRERDRFKQQIAEKEDEIRAAEQRAFDARKETERLKHRVHNGVCPCCNRSFTNVARHMKTKHPDVVPLPTKAKKRA